MSEVSTVANSFGLARKIKPDWNFAFTGSRAMFGEGVDLDLVVPFDPGLEQRVQDLGFVATGVENPEYPNSDIVQTYRLNDINLIVVDSLKAFARWKAATRLAQHLQLRDKYQRVALFQFITEGKVRETDISNEDFPHDQA